MKIKVFAEGKKESVHFERRSTKKVIRVDSPKGCEGKNRLKMLMKLESLVKGTVLKRPSASIKSPYVADVLLDDGRSVLAHSAALGCCGLSDKGAIIWLQELPVKKGADAKCSHRVCLSTLYDTDKGVHS